MFSILQMYPILMFPAGLSYNRVNADTISLIGFVPTAANRNLYPTALQPVLAEYNKVLVAHVHGFIVKAITEKYFASGVEVHRGGDLWRIHPFVLTAVQDGPEGQAIALLKDPLACRSCLTPPDKYHEAVATPGPPRTLDLVNASLADEARCEELGIVFLGGKDWAAAESQNGVVRLPTTPSSGVPMDPCEMGRCFAHDAFEGFVKFFVGEAVFPMLDSSAAKRERLWTACAEAIPPFFGLKPIDVRVAKHDGAGVRQKDRRALTLQLPLILVKASYVSGHGQGFTEAIQASVLLCRYTNLMLSRKMTDADIERSVLLFREFMEHAIRLYNLNQSHVNKHYCSKAIKHHAPGCSYPRSIRYLAVMSCLSTDKLDNFHKIMKGLLRTHNGSQLEETVGRRDMRRVLVAEFPPDTSTPRATLKRKRKAACNQPHLAMSGLMPRITSKALLVQSSSQWMCPRALQALTEKLTAMEQELGPAAIKVRQFQSLACTSSGPTDGRKIVHASAKFHDVSDPISHPTPQQPPPSRHGFLVSLEGFKERLCLSCSGLGSTSFPFSRTVQVGKGSLAGRTVSLRWRVNRTLSSRSLLQRTPKNSSNPMERRSTRRGEKSLRVFPLCGHRHQRKQSSGSCPQAVFQDKSRFL